MGETTQEVKPSVYETVRAIMRELGSFGREGLNEDVGYTFIGIDQIVAKLNPAIIEHGLAIWPNVRECWIDDKGTYRFARVMVDYTVRGPNGDQFVATMVGEANDDVDKAVNKAMTSAWKAFLKQTFFIIGEPDSDSSGVRQTGSGSSEAGAPTAAPAANLAERVNAGAERSRGGSGGGGGSKRMSTEGQRSRIWAVTHNGWDWNDIQMWEFVIETIGRDPEKLENLTFDEAKALNDEINKREKK